jgi:effector-binding domain-containing protein
MVYLIRAGVLPAEPTAVSRATLPASAVGAWLAHVYRRVADTLARQDRVPVGPRFARYTHHGDLVDVEAGYRVSSAIADDGDVIASGLPACTAVIATHVGRYEQLDTTVQELGSWMNDRSLTASGPHWEVYLTDPDDDPDPRRWHTDLVVPYRLE